MRPFYLALVCLLSLRCSTADSGSGTSDADVLAPGDVAEAETGPGDAAEDPPDGTVDTDNAEDAADTPPECPPATCGKVGTALCSGPASYTVCLQSEDQCLYATDAVPCNPGRTCAGAGECFGGCVKPQVVLLVDRSIATQGATFGEVFLGLKRALKRVGGGVDFGLVLAPGEETPCGLGASLAPKLDQGDAVLAAMQAAGTTDQPGAASVPFAAAFAEAEVLLGDRSEGELVVVLTAAKTACEDDAALGAGLRRLRERDTHVHVLWLGGAEVPEIGQFLASGGGTTSARVTLDDASITQAMIDILKKAGTCCYDPDGDTKGELCANGPDCNEADPTLSSPSCIDKECGDDGCGGSCGSCPPVRGGTSTCIDFECIETCEAGLHPCDDACVADDSIEHCGGSCAPCPVPTGGSATCDGTTCGGSCPAETHLCGAACVSATDPMACGETCLACPTATNAVATCESGGCVLTCEADFKDCGAGCVACPTAGVAEPACSASICIAGTCATGFVLVDGACKDRLIEVLDSTSTDVAMPSVDVAYPNQVVAAWHHSGLQSESRVASGPPGALVGETLFSGVGTKSGAYPRVHVDSLETVHVAYRGGVSASTAEIAVATRGPSGWATTSLVDTFDLHGYQGGDFGFFATPATLAAAYPGPGELSLTTQEGLATEHAVVTDDDGKTYADTPAVVIDADGLAHILVVENANTLVLLTGADAVYSKQTIAFVSNLGSHRIDMALRSDGTVGLCWLNNLTGKWGTWFAEEGDLALPSQLVDMTGQEACEVAYDVEDSPYVAYSTQSGEIRLATHAPDAPWKIQTVSPPTLSGFHHRWPALGLHADGGRSVVYWNGQDSEVVHVYFPPAP